MSDSRKIFAAVAAVLVLASARGPTALRAVEPLRPDSPPRDRLGAKADRSEEGESEAIHARILDYLERHGDRGCIDSEDQRRRVAEEYSRFQAEAARARRTQGAITPSQWISIGPTNGAGRMTALAFVPGSPDTVYAGAAGGGVWKTIDGGKTWLPLTDGLHDLSVGALAVAPSNPSVIYVGTGEGGYGGDLIPGIGLLKSTDGGQTWILPENVLATTFHRILVHPANPAELVAGTSGGAFRSTDGGATWTNVIAYAQYGDVPGLVRDPTDPDVLYATTWCTTAKCTFQSAHVLRSADGGRTWADRSAGLPANERGPDERTAIAITPQNPQILYAARGVRDLFDTGSLFSHIYKTTNAGVTWTDLTAVPNTYMNDQSYWDNAIVVSPSNANVVIAGGVGYIRSTDGGTTFSQAVSDSGVHVDCHDLRYNGSRLWIANDGGIWSSDDDGNSASGHNDGLVTRQFYAMASDPSNPARVIGGTQDNGTLQRLAPGTEWRSLFSGDGIACAIHPLSPEIAWISAQGDTLRRTRAAGSDNPPLEDVSPPLDDGEWVPFLSIVQSDPRETLTLFTGSTRLWKSRDGGDTWQPLSTTTLDGSVWLSSNKDIIRWVAIPAVPSQLLIVAKGHGIFRSADAGQTWSAGSGLPDAVVTHIEMDPRDPTIAFASIAATSGSSLYRSGDGGLTWTPSASGLPAFAAQVVRFDPLDSTILYCGTDVGIFQSLDRGTSWNRIGAGLPSSSVHDLQIAADGSFLRVATHGRGVWEMALPQPPNTSPTVTITAPAGPVSVAAGDEVEFAGGVSDIDPGEPPLSEWFFPDDGSVTVLAPGTGSARHTFRHGGIFPVALTASDRRGARTSAVVMIFVRESADSCRTPNVIPSGGPFPYTVAWNDMAGQTESTDPDDPCLPGLGKTGSTWFEFTPAAAAPYTLSTCTDVNTAISIFTGPACGPYKALPLSCPTIGAEGGCGFGATTVTLSAQAGQTLRILLGGVVADNVGPVRMTISLAGSSDGSPHVDRVGLAQGPETGGTLVVIEGSGFGENASVTFGGLPTNEVTFLTDRVLTARTPPHAEGPVNVAVTVPGAGTGALGNGYFYETVESASRLVPEPLLGDRRTRSLPPH